jgi:hypothetical protein
LEANLIDQFSIQIYSKIWGKRGRSVGIMRVGVVDPDEKFLSPIFVKPWKDFIVNFLGSQVPSRGKHNVIVKVEPVVEFKARLEDTKRYECSCLKTLLSKELSYRGSFFVRMQNLSVIVELEKMWGQRIKQGCMCRCCYRDQAVAVFIQDSFLRKIIDIRCAREL